MNYLTLPTADETPAVVNAVIEVPGGQTNKYGIHRHTDLPPHALREIEHFFAIYKENWKANARRFVAGAV